MEFRCINNDKDLMQNGFQFRYEIFCLEKQFFDKNNYENCCETDIYDRSSLHFAAIDGNNQVVGYVRLICESEHGLPIEKKKLDCDLYSYIDNKSKIAELSRLAIRHSCRRYVDNCYSYHIQFGLFRMAYQSCLELGITHICAIMEKPLYRSLKKVSFDFNLIGPEFDDHGMVAPYIGDLSELKDNLFKIEFQNLFFYESGIPRYDTKFVFWDCLAG